MNDAARWRLVDGVFAAALERPPGERAAFIDAACAGDLDLRREVERLLVADELAGTFLEPAAGGPPELGAEPENHRLGPYRLLRRIGGGGMGAVWLARRDDEQYQRDVAIKILRSGLESTEAEHRFLAERQILARLEHPGIARLYDGGRTDDGRPFLVMELVDGLPLDEYCDRHELTIDGRLALFRKVCAAVQHAHQNLLVHRDLKPGNVLVTADGEPKLLDFGIAKRLAPESLDEALTRTGSRVMTPIYASPEQVKGEPITTASDVYSLGVVLYELLAGRSPYRAAGGLPHEVERAICEEEPERPSQAVLRPPRSAGDPTPEAIARARCSRPAALRRRLQGDLDTIVLMALRKEPERRYGSASQLADDLESHLRYLPVAARPDTLLYRTRKLLRRRRGAMAAAAAGALLVLGFVLGLVGQGRRLARERDKARWALSFLVDTFENADPYQTRGEQITAAEILAQGASRVERDLAGRPDAQAAVMDAIGQAHVGLGRIDDAVPLLERALELRRRSPGGDPLDLAASLEHLAHARYEQSEFEAAEALLREALALRRRADGDPLDLAKALNQLGVAIATRTPTEEVEALHREALDIARQAEGPRGPVVAESLLLAGRLARDHGDYEQAERLYREGLAIQRQVLPPRDPTAVRNQAELAAILLDAGKPREAEVLLRETSVVLRQLLGDDHPDLMSTINNIGMARLKQGDAAGAEAAYREALALPRPASAEADGMRAITLGNLALALQEQDRLDESIPILREAIDLRRESFGERHPLVAQAVLHLARTQRLRRRYAEARTLARQALAIVEEAEGPDHPHVAFPLRELAAIARAQGRPDEAEPHLRRALDLRRRELPPENPDVARAELSLAGCLVELGRFQEAEPLLRKGRATLLAQFGAEEETVRQAAEDLAAIERAKGETGER